MVNGPGPVDSIIVRCKQMKDHLFRPGEKLALVFLDTETTGLSPNADWIYELAALFVVIENGEHTRVHAFHSYLNWVDAGVPYQSFDERILKTNMAMSAKNPTVRRPSTEEVTALGKHPGLVLSSFAKTCQDFFALHGEGRKAFAGHNVFSFDANFLHNSYSKLGIISPIGGDILDTGLLVKAAQTNDLQYDPSSYTYGVDWLLKLKNARLKIKWSLADFCEPRFQLKAKLPEFINQFLHTSLTDVWMTYVLFRMFDSPEDLSWVLG